MLEEKTITATAETGGAVSAATTKAFYGDSVTLTATPNAGYWFDGWYNGETKVSSLKKYTFTVTGNTALTAKFVEATVDGAVENGSFEANYDNGWSTSWNSDFSIANASAEAPAKAIDGSKILKVSATGTWHVLNQNLTLEANKEYVISFWYYRLNDGYISLKFGNSTADNALVKESWLNTDAMNKWVYKTWTVTTTDDATVKLFLCAFDGTAYIDDVRITATDSIGNMVQNGDMTNAGKALNAWSVGDATAFTYEAETEGYTGTGALKVTGDGSTSTYHNMTYTFTVKTNTDYIFRFAAKNAVGDEKTMYKVLNGSGATLLPSENNWANGNGADGNGTGWGVTTWKINSGENTTIKVLFVENGDFVTYFDDIYFGEAIETNVTSSNEAFGKVTATKTTVGQDDEVTYTATATAGGKLLGWRVGDSETLIEGVSYTYKGFDDLTLTAVFEAALGNVNGDSAIDATDMTALRGSILGTADYTALGDMNENAQNDIRDLVALYKAISN